VVNDVLGYGARRVADRIFHPPMVGSDPLVPTGEEISGGDRAGCGAGPRPVFVLPRSPRGTGKYTSARGYATVVPANAPKVTLHITR
jgi:hypothetical protein